MQLKPQDVLVALKLVSLGAESEWTYAQLAMALDMSASQAHAAVRRALAARLLVDDAGAIVPNPGNLEEFLVHGIRFVFVPERGELTRGIPTAHGAPPLSRQMQAGGEPPPVWPHPHGKARGLAFAPLFRSAPEAARGDRRLYELLALIDGIRGGRARERRLAARMLAERLGRGHASG